MNVFKLKDYRLADTIVALATFPSKSALGVIKISGKKAIAVASKIFKSKTKKNLSKAKNFTLHYGWIKNPGLKNSSRKDIVIDEVLISIMRGPTSYTREDVVEISSHGGAIVLDKILKIITKQGIRIAYPGEFTYRALLRGRIDLIQAESILGIVDAKTDKSLEYATQQLRGENSKKLKLLKEKIKELYIETESVINFPEDEIDLPLTPLKRKIGNIEKLVANLKEGSFEAKVMSEGLRCVICGKTNAGKSTLFNRLLKEERVIVSRVSGTTRDVIEETINIKGVPLRIYDTAGILDAKDLITKKALEKTSKAFSEADLVILVFDGSRRLNEDDFLLLKKAKNKNIILVINKADLRQRIDKEVIFKIKAPKVWMSALKSIGLKKIEQAVYNSVYKKGIDRQDIVFLSQHQRKILDSVYEKIKEAGEYLDKDCTIDFINLLLSQCLNDIGKLTGEVFSEDVLESIFSQFCIGK